MRILVTGNLGYVGSVLVGYLRQQHPDAEIMGLDLGFFAPFLSSKIALPERALNGQLFKDVRAIKFEDLQDVDAIVHLAAISNDPMGKQYETVTGEINYQSSIALAKLAKEAGVKNYVFASSCSVYGFTEGGPRVETDTLNPLTAYAQSKIDTERHLAELDRGDMVITCLRFATACGMSPRLRLDLVVNDFVACALSSGEITVLSDGSPWRPLIAVSDMTRAIDWAIQRRQENGGGYLAINAGSNEWNYQVRDLAHTVAKAVPGTKVSINTQTLPDKRSYQVDFSLFAQLAPQYQPQETLQTAIEGLVDGLRAVHFSDENFRTGEFIRLKTVEHLQQQQFIDANLNWLR